MYNFINLFKLFKLEYIIKLLIKNGFNVNYVTLNAKSAAPSVAVYYIDRYGKEGHFNFYYGNHKVEGYAYMIRWTNNTDDRGQEVADYSGRACNSACELVFEVKRAYNHANRIETTIADWTCD